MFGLSVLERLVVVMIHVADGVDKCMSITMI